MRSPLLLVLAVSIGVASLRGQRVEYVLDGQWEVRPDGAPAKPWRPIQVPSTFETALGNAFDGVAVYRRKFSPREAGDAQKGDQLVLRFAAVATYTEVRVDGEKIGEHLGGWTPFQCSVPAKFWRRESISIEVRVDERVGHNTQGFLPIIAPHFGGIWQGVRLSLRRGPTLDPDALVVLTSWIPGEGSANGRASLRVDPGVPLTSGTSLRCTLIDGVTSHELSGSLTVPPTVKPWSPAAPNRYQLRVELLGARGEVLDRIVRRLVFTDVAAKGRQILVNGKPFRVRGILHWGFEPPSLAPHQDVERWRVQLRYLKSMGFNLVKACLWFPPPSFFAAAEEVGMFVWQEYPAWHPDFSEKRLPELLREYEEFFRIDRQRPIILARSLTCETGRAAASAAVIEKLFRRCKAVTGGALVEDDSSWIAWNRFHDFYDDHPYGNNGPWLGRLRGFDAHIRERTAKPLLLGEAIASDTWLSSAVFADVNLRSAWWQPYAFESQRAFAETVRTSMGAAGAAALVPDSLRYALRARRYQIESFRRALPDAGYVVSVVRDFRKARMGLFDDLGQPKWDTEQFAWHRDDMIVLEDARAIRSVRQARMPRIAASTQPAMKVTAAKFLNGKWIPDVKTTGPSALARDTYDPGHGQPWIFYRCPEPPTLLPNEVRISKRLDAETLAWVEQGGRLLLTPGGAGSLRHQGLWFLRGAPYAPQEHLLFQRVPREFLFDLQPFDFDGPVLIDTPLIRGMQKILGFWDTHDQLEKVDTFTFLAEAQVGKGRILACALSLDVKPEVAFGDDPKSEARAPNPARAWLRGELLRYLATTAAPSVALSPELIQGLRKQIEARHRRLDGTWLLAGDSKDVGVREGWQAVDFDDKKWIKARAGIHWESVGLPHHNGVGWYRKHFDVPGFWQKGQPLYAVFDGVDDSYTLFVNGNRVRSFGDPKTGETVWLIRTHADISKFLRPGKNLIALRVVDHQGAGGLHRDVNLMTADPRMEAVLQR